MFDILKSQNCVLIKPQTTVLAITGSKLMQIFVRNSPLWPGGWGLGSEHSKQTDIKAQYIFKKKFKDTFKKMMCIENLI